MPLAPTQIELAAIEAPEARCLCGSDLSLHQPDPAQPDRLLGTCDGCKAWYVLEPPTGLMALIPAQISRQP